MPRPLRITMFFGDEAYGWSETHYDTSRTTLTGAIQTAVNNLVPARQLLLATGPWLKYLRASFDDTFRDSQVFYLPAPSVNSNNAYVNNPNWSTTAAGVAWTVALARKKSGDLYSGNVYVSGLPFDTERDITSPQDDAKIVNAFNTYANVLTNVGYGFQVWARDIANFPNKPITAIGQVGQETQLTVPGHGFSQGIGLRVFVSKTIVDWDGTTPVRVNGPWAIKRIVDANTLVLAGLNFPVGAGFISGQIQQQKKDVVPYTDFQLERFTHRKRGRPFDSPRGRSRRGTRSLAR